MAADPSGLDLLLMASNSANAGGAGLPLSSPPFFGEGHEQEEDYSCFDLAIRREKLDTCYPWATESKAHAEDLLFGARPGVIWWWHLSRAVHSCGGLDLHGLCAACAALSERAVTLTRAGARRSRTAAHRSPPAPRPAAPMK